MTDDDRPDPRELGGLSEHSSGGEPPAPPPDAEDGPEREDPLAERPDELGRKFLEHATQQPEAETERDETEREGTGDEQLATMGERYMREHSAEAEDSTDPLVTDMPDETEHEERLSIRTRETQREHGRQHGGS